MLLQEWNWDTAFRIQREEGRQEGEYKKATKTARAALKLKLPIEQIIQLSGLASNEISSISGRVNA
jgi:predicted transposase YdaD